MRPLTPLFAFALLGCPAEEPEDVTDDETLAPPGLSVSHEPVALGELVIEALALVPDIGVDRRLVYLHVIPRASDPLKNAHLGMFGKGLSP